MIAELNKKYASKKKITIINSIDQYNNYCRFSKEHSNVLLMSQHSYFKLSQYFNQYHSIVVFTDVNKQISFKKYQNVALFTSEGASIERFVDQFAKNKETEEEKAMKKKKKKKTAAMLE